MMLENKYLILSDIHGNVSALNAVLDKCECVDFAGIIILGDCIDYGMRSNEIIDKLIEMEKTKWNGKIMVNIWGNHEKLIIDKDVKRLSTDRGRDMARYTAEHLSEKSVRYISYAMGRNGIQEFEAEGMKCLAVHGSLEDNYWKAIEPDNLWGDYIKYDIVLSGHSHYSHCVAHFYLQENPELRNKKAVMFINPGSVGQPRNQNPCAQYAILSLPSRTVELKAVPYDVEYEQSLFSDEVDEFYKIRLGRGI